MSLRPHLPLINVALVEDDLQFQETFQAAIAMAPGMNFVASASSKALALQMLQQAPVDVLIVDLGLPDGSGIDVISAAQVSWPDCKIMVSTAFGDEMHVIQSIEAGANGYLLKDSSAKTMTEEIRCLYDGGSPISPLIAHHILKRFRLNSTFNDQPTVTQPVSTPAAENMLSVREQEVLVYITKGFNYDEIANLMQISRYTVLSFVRRIYAKLEVKSKAEAIYEARIQGLLAN